MPGRTHARRKSSHPGGFFGFGIAETAIIGSAYLAGIGASYWIWPSLLPGFIAVSLILTAHAGTRRAEARLPGRDGRDASLRGTWSIAAALLIDMATLCAGEAALKQLWMQLDRMHILAVILSLCVTLPTVLLACLGLRGIVLRRIRG